MSLEWKDGADLRLAKAIQSEVEGDMIVRSYALIIDAVDDDGDRRILVNAHPNQRSLDTLGLLRAGLLIEEEGFRRDWFEDED